MNINIPVSQMYKCIDRSTFEEEVSNQRGCIFFKKSIRFINPDNSETTRDIFVSDDTIEYIKLYDDGLRVAEVFFKERHPEFVEDRQRNDIFLDVKYLPEQDLVVIGNKHYDLTNDFSTVQFFRLEKTVTLNPEKEPELLAKIIKNKTKKDITSFIDASNKMYAFRNNKLMVENLSFNIDESFNAGQHEMFISNKICIICMVNNKVS